MDLIKLVLFSKTFIKFYLIYLCKDELLKLQ